jgi:hypothetical protein
MRLLHRIEQLEARIAPAPADLTLPNLSGLNGFALTSSGEIDTSNSVGDFNGDGLDDLGVASLNASSGRGVLRVIFGRAGA